MQEAYSYKGKAGKPCDNLDLIANNYGAVWKRPTVKEGKLENLVVFIVCIFFAINLIFSSFSHDVQWIPSHFQVFSIDFHSNRGKGKLENHHGVSEPRGREDYGDGPV